MRPYGKDLRRRVVKARERGEKIGDISDYFDVSESVVKRWTKRYRETGSYEPSKQGRPLGSSLDEHKDVILGWIKSDPDLTLEEIAQLCADKLGIKLTLQAVWHRLKQYGMSYKKNDSRQRAKAS